MNKENKKNKTFDEYLQGIFTEKLMYNFERVLLILLGLSFLGLILAAIFVW